jgi:hypothetical protein
MSNTNGNGVRFLNLLAYIAVVAVGVMLAIGYFLKGNGGILNNIANTLAYIVTACYSWRYARSKGVWWIVVWAASVVLIAVFMIVPLFAEK